MVRENSVCRGVMDQLDSGEDPRCCRVFSAESSRAEQSWAAGLCSYLLRWFYKMRWRTMIATVPCLVSLTLTVDSSSRQVQTPANCFLRSLVAGACRITWKHNAVLFILKQLLHQLRIQQNIRDPPIVVNVKSFVCSTLQKHIPKYCQNVSHLNEW